MKQTYFYFSGDETIQCRIELLKLLLQGVDSPTVSITHYLLGYPLQARVKIYSVPLFWWQCGQTRRYNFERLPLNDERRFWGCLLKLYLRVCPKLAILTLIQASLSKASLQDPGILNSPKTVLHSLLGILSNKEIRQENAALIQYGYELIYKICSNSETFLIGSPIARHHYLTFDWLIGWPMRNRKKKHLVPRWDISAVPMILFIVNLQIWIFQLLQIHYISKHMDGYWNWLHLNFTLQHKQNNDQTSWDW